MTICANRKDPKILSRLLGQGSGNEFNTGVAFVQDNRQPDNSKQQIQEQAFATNGGASASLNRKKICRRCGTDGHTSVECNSGQDKVEIYRQSTQANQGVSQLIHATDNAGQQSMQANQGVSQLIHAVDWTGVNSTDDEAINWTFHV
jgi:hypothetical protein